ncbi:MAG: 6-pyruvoyl trahydropterin synthase family protein [Pirellulales bacterium]
MTEQYHVRIAGDGLVLSVAHFITFGHDVCERLHGHDYRVAGEIHGPLDEDRCVVDFVAARDCLAGVLRELDHRVLLPTEHPRIHLAVDRETVRATWGTRAWVFPREDCTLLAVPNTTAEMLARHIGRRWLDAVESRTGARPTLVRIEVGEGTGQSAVCELRGE